jgi:alpha-galactosidase
MKNLLVLFFGLTLIATASGQVKEVEGFEALGYDVKILGNLKSFILTTQVEDIEDDLAIITIKLTSNTPEPPPKFSLKWSTPSNGIHGYWSSASGFNRTIRADWGPSAISSKLAKNAPVMMLLGIDDSNKLTYAVSEAKNTVRLTSSVREEDARIYCQIDFFTEKEQNLNKYTVQIRFDARNLKYYTSLGEVATWWAGISGFEPASVPDHARLPIYSTWYSYHQNVNAAVLLAECKTAKELGYESIIVDDGWQTLETIEGMPTPATGNLNGLPK